MGTLYRDLKTTSFNGKTITGLTSAEYTPGHGNMNRSGDDAVGRQYAGITALVAEITLEQTDPLNKRDMKTLVHGATTVSEARRFEYTENATARDHSADDDNWITHVFVTDTYVSGSWTSRDYSQAINTAGLSIGTKATLTCKTVIASATSGLTGNTYETVTITSAMITGGPFRTVHGDYAEATFNFENDKSAGTLNVSSTDAAASITHHVADSGTLSWIAPKAETSGADVNVEVSNAVLTGMSRTFAHGEMTTARFTFRAYSSDGSTSPVAIT